MLQKTTSNKKILSNANKENDGNILMGWLIPNLKIVSWNLIQNH